MVVRIWFFGVVFRRDRHVSSLSPSDFPALCTPVIDGVDDVGCVSRTWEWRSSDLTHGLSGTETTVSLIRPSLLDRKHKTGTRGVRTHPERREFCESPVGLSGRRTGSGLMTFREGT